MFAAYCLLGFLQGIFEWLPLSSEGITALASQFLISKGSPVDLALFLHLGTFLAVLFFFRRDWQLIVRGQNRQLARFLLLATPISLVVGYPLYQLVSNTALGNNLLLITGFGLLLTAYFHQNKRLVAIDFDRLAIITGFLQGLAVVPGLSRSAATIFGLSLAKLAPSEILRTSYLMSAPVVLASSLYLFLKNPSLAFEAWPALLTSFLIGFFSLRFLLNLASKLNFFKFALLFGLACFLGGVIGLIA